MMVTSRDIILKKLRAAQKTVPAAEAESGYLPVVPTADGLLTQFSEQAAKLGSIIHHASSEAEVIDTLLSLIGSDTCVMCWSDEHLPLPGLRSALAAHQINLAAARDDTVRVGITGVDAALAATGSLVLASGLGKARTTSLLPPVHIAVVWTNQIVASLESWVELQRGRGLEAFQQTASTMIISGPSRTADIAMQLTLGMHGPAELHIIIVPCHIS